MLKVQVKLRIADKANPVVAWIGVIGEYQRRLDRTGCVYFLLNDRLTGDQLPGIEFEGVGKVAGQLPTPLDKLAGREIGDNTGHPFVGDEYQVDSNRLVLVGVGGYVD